MDHGEVRAAPKVLGKDPSVLTAADMVPSEAPQAKLGIMVDHATLMEAQ